VPRSTAAPPRFKTEALPFGTTLARQIAKQHLSTLNNVYWVGERAHSFVRRSFPSIPMPTPGPGVHGCFGTAGEWQDAVDEFRVWRRQHVLVSAASLLEVYVKSASIAAFSAKPELVDRSLAGVDAFAYVRFPERAPPYLRELIELRSESFTNGPWKERLHRMQILLGKLPDGLLQLESDLQSMQSIRNRIAHSYGMNGELRRTPWEEARIIDVPPSRIDSVTKVVSSAIQLLDTKIFGSIVGGYEILHEYSVWLNSQTKNRRPVTFQNRESAFRDHIGKAFGSTPGRDYIDPMIKYYDSLT
jgi:hypothetical protein